MEAVALLHDFADNTNTIMCLDTHNHCALKVKLLKNIPLEKIVLVCFTFMSIQSANKNAIHSFQSII